MERAWLFIYRFECSLLCRSLCETIKRLFVVESLSSFQFHLRRHPSQLCNCETNLQSEDFSSHLSIDFNWKLNLFFSIIHNFRNWLIASWLEMLKSRRRRKTCFLSNDTLTRIASRTISSSRISHRRTQMIESLVCFQNAIISQNHFTKCWFRFRLWIYVFERWQTASYQINKW